MFRKVSRQEFNDALTASNASPAFRKQLARFVSFERELDTNAMLHDGDVRVTSFKAPGLAAL